MYFSFRASSCESKPSTLEAIHNLLWITSNVYSRSNYLILSTVLKCWCLFFNSCSYSFSRPCTSYFNWLFLVNSLSSCNNRSSSSILTRTAFLMFSHTLVDPILRVCKITTNLPISYWLYHFIALWLNSYSNETTETEFKSTEYQVSLIS